MLMDGCRPSQYSVPMAQPYQRSSSNKTSRGGRGKRSQASRATWRFDKCHAYHLKWYHCGTACTHARPATRTVQQPHPLPVRRGP